MGTKEEIDEMFDALESAVVDDNLTDAPVTDEPVVGTDPPTDPETDPPSDPETDAPKTDAPRTDAPTTDPPTDDELERFKKENDELRKKIDDMSAPKTQSPQTDAPSTFAPIEEHDFVGELDIDDLTRDPAEFNKLLNKIYGKAVEDTRGEIQGRTATVLTQVPDLVKTNVAIQENLMRLTNEFYEDNEDLKPFGKVVSTVYDELVQENPNETFEVILNKVEKETRSRLELPKGKVKPKPKQTDNDPPPLPRHKGKKGARETNQKTDPLVSEIDEMNRSLNS